MRSRDDHLRGVSVLLALCLAIACTNGEPPRRSSRDDRGAEGSNLLLITIDTLRADHLSAYGYPRRTSPTLERLAAEGVRFERAAVQWPKTGPSFASMMTATYPKDNGIVRRVGIEVPREMELLAEVLEAAGYANRAVVANGALAKDFHFDQGFERYVETWRSTVEEAGGLDPNGAERVTDLALELARGLGGERPFFLWVHYLDPHFPYAPPEPWRDLFQGDQHYDPEPKIPVDGSKSTRQMAAIGAKQVLDGRDELAFYRARYDAEIAYADAEIGRLLEGLGGLGLLERTLTVVTSDHGESLGEHHYYFDHGRFGFQTCVRVPLIFHYPGVLEPRVDPEPVELISLAPTLLEFAGIPLEAALWKQGRSLLPRLRGESVEGAVAFSEAGYAEGGRWQRIAQDRRHKLVFAKSPKAQRWIGGEGVTEVLYDLESDPGETRNVAAEHPRKARRLRKALREWLRSGPGGARRERAVSEEMDPETREQLEALGYL